LLSLRWLYRLTWALYERVGQIVSWLSIILEGEGGVLWTLFLLVLLMTLAAPVSTGR
jgi:hypothetical protein